MKNISFYLSELAELKWQFCDWSMGFNLFQYFTKYRFIWSKYQILKGKNALNQGWIETVLLKFSWLILLRLFKRVFLEKISLERLIDNKNRTFKRDLRVGSIHKTVNQIIVPQPFNLEVETVICFILGPNLKYLLRLPHL